MEDRKEAFHFIDKRISIVYGKLKEGGRATGRYYNVYSRSKGKSKHLCDLKMQILEPHPTFEAELLGWGWDQLLTKPCFRILRHTKNGLH